MFGFRAGSGSQISVSPLRLSHSAECARLHASAFAHAWSAGDFETLLAASTSLGDRAALGQSQALAGFVVSRCAADEAEILSIAVDPAFRRRGIGRKLLLGHLGRLAGAAVGKVFLEVDDLNIAALGLYTDLGFAEVGKRKAYYRQANGIFGNALILRCDLA